MSSPTARAAAGSGVVAALLGSLASAYPDAAPWGAADPGAEEHCASCHYDFDAVVDSGALAIAGLPATVEPGADYALRVNFDADAAVAGFQLIASAGRLEAAGDDIEAIGPAARSTAPRQSADGFAWRLRWFAPDELSAPLQLLLAASAANDDQSPFGDTIHYRRFEMAADEKAGETE